jgi:serine phosphatase RsbU (regulator of sigma subunit)
LRLASRRPVSLRPYRASEGILGEIAANFIPGSRRAIPVVVTARNWRSGAREDWVICQVGLNYKRTIADLSRMGLQPASWVAPFATITLALLFVYVSGLVLSISLSHRIGAAIDGLSRGAVCVGKGDFSVRVSIPGRDQLGLLASVFNRMTRDLQMLREQEKQTAQLEWDLALAREIQEHLYPPPAAISRGVTLWGINTPARRVSGDLYEFFSFGPNQVGLLCADVSGKGVSAALMMAHLQSLVRGRLLAFDDATMRPAPEPFITALNRDFHARFGSNRYATMFYGEFDSRSEVLRYINAGHCPGILISETGEVTQLVGGDLPVGIFPETSYQALQANLAKGCTLVVYTDGVTDALNTQGEPFGEERLLSCCRSLPKGAAGETIGNLISEQVCTWAAGVDQFDDTTILVLAVE